MADVTHFQYDENFLIWDKCNDTVEGEDALHAADKNMKGKYLRVLNPSDRTQFNIDRNNSYVKCARFQNFTAATLQGFLGMAFRKPPIMPDLPIEIDYIIEDADGGGLSLEQQTRKTMKHAAQFGRVGALTEMPDTEGQEVTRQDVANGIRAHIKIYSAKSILDWYPDNPTNLNPLTYVRLKEDLTRFNDEGKKETIERHLVLLLESGYYIQEIYEKDEDQAWQKVGEHIPKKSNGQPFGRIPFSFCGSLNNNPDVDKPLILDIANANLGMYQEDANLRASSFAFSAATAHIADDQFFNYFNMESEDGSKKEIKFGESSVIVTGSGGSVSIISPPENSLANTIKQSDLEILVALGAQVVQPGGAAETAEAVRIKSGSTASKLSVTVQNVTDFYNQQLQNVAEFMGATIAEGETLELNQEFFDERVTPEMLNQLVLSWQAGAISKSVLNAKLVKGSIIPEDEDLEAMDQEIAEELPDFSDQ